MVKGRKLAQGPGREGATAFLASGGSAAMNALVTQHVLTAPKTLAALPAGERPRAGMSLAVAHQVLTPVEGLPALTARMRFFPNCQRPQRWTASRGYTRVSASVAPQVLLAPEGLAALRAGMWLLSCVALPLAQQVGRLQRRLAALRTRCGTGVWSHQQGREGRQTGCHWGAAWFLFVGACGLDICRRWHLCSC